jgi:starch synthase (maltosyl-transferring)
MAPATGDRCLRFVGDRIRFTVRDLAGQSPLPGWRARLRTNLGRADSLRREILEAHTRSLPLAGASWRDLPMQEESTAWSLELPLAEVGYFKAKAYLVDPDGWQHWPEGPDFGLAVHPSRYRTGNILYCAFPRMFGRTRELVTSTEPSLAGALKPLDADGFSIIPPSGKLRDLTACLPHVFQKLGCRILHLLPVHPTPTTYARFGRYGSPYAALDLTAIDPALVVFDRRTTGIDQFRELTYAAHLHGGRVILDIVINHTGWGSVLQENHPEWFLRNTDGNFISPGAWGVTWEDLVELNHANVALWDDLSEMFLTWCRRGVDGFRCDAGYKVPVPVWQYIVARVQQEFPETIFLLEGLGGAWEATEALLTEGGMQWAYSELFQNYSGVQVGGYLDHSLKQSQRSGLLVHYSETHDNERLAEKGKGWSLLRNRLCALASVSGGFGFTCGVEWLASEKILVHGSTGMAWNNAENLVPELSKLNQLLAEHPCFFDGAVLTRLSPPDSPIYALLRQSEEGLDSVLVLVNTDAAKPAAIELELVGGPTATGLSTQDREWTQSRVKLPELNQWVDLLGQPPPASKKGSAGKTKLSLTPGAGFCLSPSPTALGLSGENYRNARARAAWGLSVLGRLIPVERLTGFDWRSVAGLVQRSPAEFLTAVSEVDAQLQGLQGSAPSAPVTPAAVKPIVALLKEILETPAESKPFPRVVNWNRADCDRVTLVPPGHWLLVQDSAPFRASLLTSDDHPAQNVESIPAQEGHFACFPPRKSGTEAKLQVERYAEQDTRFEGLLWFLPPSPLPADLNAKPARPTDLVLLTNGRGGMARMCVDLGQVRSKYDCVLGANFHPELPVDRHVLAKRIRVWVNADGFISPLDFRNLASFEAGPPALWHFIANAGDGRTVQIDLLASMLDGKNTLVFQFSRPSAETATGKQLPPEADVRLTVRIDVEDRNFHWETKRNGGADHHFSANTRSINSGLGQEPPPGSGKRVGFEFTPAADRGLWVFADAGRYLAQPEWSENIGHPVEQSRGQTGAGDAFSPGWFEMPLTKGANIHLVVTAERSDAGAGLPVAELSKNPGAFNSSTALSEDVFSDQLHRAITAFVVQRGRGRTVIAGYPWFLDWGRDTFICARGLLAAGLTNQVRDMVLVFARFEKDGTLPNTIFGEDASNRDTSDAPLWFGLVCEELAAAIGPIETIPADGTRTLGAVLESIATHYVRGTPNGIRMDPESGLVWSPSHFTWMDTNYPACTPREGYPVEIQALWIRLLRQLHKIGSAEKRGYWGDLAARALTSLQQRFWLEDRGYFADVLLAPSHKPAADAVVDDALRSNCLLLISLGLADGSRARRCVSAAGRFLVVPGALRSLAALPVSVPLPNRAANGGLLNDPHRPYWGRYEGDEDTRRKPAYHNGTAWTWTFPAFCESLARAWNCSPEATAAARAYLGSMARLLTEGCLGQLPEITDGDAPHHQRGCDAQAWGATEALRVWKFLQRSGSQ